MEIITSALLNAVGLFVALSGVGGEMPVSSAGLNQASVEVGLAELSPLGEAGGYAMPASEESNPRPTVTLQVRNVTRGQSWVNQNISIAPGDQVALKWTSNRTDNCKATEHAEADGFSTGGATSGTDTDLVEPHPGGSRTYGISCRETNGNRTATADRNVKAYDAYLDFEAKNYDNEGEGWKSGTLTIDPGNSVQLKWKATPGDKAKSCNVVEGSGFSTGGDTQGIDDINEPGADKQANFTLRCIYEPNNIEVVRTITIKVRDIPEPPLAIIERLRFIGGEPTGGWQRGDVNLNAGEEVQIRWDWDRDYGRPTTCEATSGPGFSTGNAISGTDTTINEPGLGGDQQYTVRCTNAGGSDSDSLRVFMKEAPEPSAKLELSHRNSNGGWTDWTTGNVEVDLDVDVRVRWEGKNATRCDATAGNGFSTGGAVGPQIDETINEPGTNASMQVTVRCENIAGAKVSDSSTITVVPPEQPTALSVKLEAKNVTNDGPWQDDALTVGPDKTVRVRWSTGGGVGSITCTAQAGSGFSTNPSNGPSGEDNVTTPAAGATDTFRVRCVDSASPQNVDTDTVVVTSREEEPIAELTMRRANASLLEPWSSNLTVDPGEQVHVRWDSEYADSCTGTGPGFSTGGATSGTDTSVTEPDAGEYADFRVTCTNSVGSAIDTGRLTVRDEGGPAPTAQLEARNVTTGGTFSTANLTIASGNQIALRWSSTNASSCASDNFDVEGQTSGTKNGIYPVAANTTYRVVCSGATDSLTVFVGNATQNPEIEVDDDTVRRGDSVRVSWDPNGNTGCTVTGPNLSRTGVSSAGNATVTIEGESTFVINCSGRTDEVTVRIEPIIIES